MGISTKSDQRRYIKSKMKELTDDYCRSSDKEISGRLTSLDEYREAKVIFTYVSTETEADTKAIIKHALESGKKVAVPKCTGPGIMEVFEISSFDDLEPGAYNIPEPKSHCNTVSPSEIDFAVIPCISCDRNCERLGHGMGFYDRYLKRGSFTTAALCREELLLDEVITEEHDRPVDYVITEGDIYVHINNLSE